MESEKMYEWLIIFFVHEIPRNYIDSTDMLKSIQATGSGNDNLVFLIRDAYSINANQVSEFTLNVCRLDFDTNTQKYFFAPVAHLTGNNEDKHCWEKGFEYIFTNFSSKRKMVVTYSHGAGFGINAETSVVIRPRTTTLGCNPMPFSPKKSRQGAERYYFFDEKEVIDLLDMPSLAGENELENEVKRGYLLKMVDRKMCKNLDLLWMADLAQVWDKLLDTTQIDMLLMVNCDMQLFDNGYILKHNLKYLVASEGEFNAKGYDYVDLLTTLQKTPGISNVNLARHICDAFQAYYLRLNMKGDLDVRTLFANDLSYFSQALVVFDEFLDILLNDMEKYILGLITIRNKKVRNVAFDILHGNKVSLEIIDAYSWIKLVTTMFDADFAASKIADRFDNLLKQIVVAQFVGDIIKNADGVREDKFGYTGIAIYYPQDYLSLQGDCFAWCAYFDRYIPSPFRTDSKWSHFLHAYFQEMALSQVQMLS